MATKSMAYDHPEYLVTKTMGFGGSIAAAVSSKTAQVAAYAACNVKAMVVSVITAGGTVNDIELIRQATGGTALTTLATIATVIGTSAGGYTTYALMTGTNTTLAQGDLIWAAKGSADGVGVYGVGIECVMVPGASITA